MAGAATLEINRAQSKITVSVVSTLHDFTGTLTNYEAKIECDPPETLPYVADVAFDFKDLKTGNSERDADMLKWLKYSSNPQGTFNLIGWKRDETNSIARGELTLHGVKNPIEVPVVVTRDKDRYDITGSVKLDYRDFSLPVIRKLLLLKVSPHLTVKFHLAGTLGK